MDIQYFENKALNQTEVLHLYNNVNWKAYTKQPQVLMQAIQQSLYVLSAWDNDKLVGLIRVIGDGSTIIYIQDILVLNVYQRKGIGKQLMDKVLAKFKAVRQKVLITDKEEKTKIFYESMGFQLVDRHNIVAYIKMENII